MRDDQFLATCDAAKVLNCTPDNVRSLERRGRLTAIRTPGGRRIFRALDVERLARERQGHPREESTGN
ncbi:MAG: MerR family DNA-binding transcriptional regulator [Nitrospira sp. NTP1]|nr:MerR family DNA-binding transcriptional regulator [Nitrospira sp. NTP1]